MVHTKIIGNFAIVGHIEDGEVSELANFEGADAVVAREGIGGVDGGGGDGFGGRHAHLRASERQNGGHGKRGTGAGIEVGGQSDDGSRVNEFARGTVMREAEMETAAGKHCAGDVGTREGADVAGRYFFEMVGACRVHLNGESRSSGARELFGVKAQAQAAGSRGGKDFARLRDGERAAVAKYIAEFCEAFPRDTWEPFAADEFDIGVWRFACAIAIFARDNVSAEECADDVERLLALEVAEDDKNFALAFPGEAISGFGFERGGSVRGELREMLERAAF